MRADAEPDNVRIAGMRRGPVTKEGASIGRPVKFKNAFTSLEAFDTKTGAWRSFCFQILYEASYRSLEPATLGWCEAVPVTQKRWVCLERRHYSPVPSLADSSRAAKKVSMLS